jgi:DNA-damage-inducible protein D
MAKVQRLWTAEEVAARGCGVALRRFLILITPHGGTNSQGLYTFIAGSTMANIVKQLVGGQESPFDEIRQVDGQGKEFWSARDLMPMLGYAKWQKFKGVIETAQENLETVTGQVINHITPTDKMVKRPQGGGTTQLDYKLSRLACYHVALCCDSRGNDQVKFAKHYFAVKTHQAETVIPQLSQENEALRLMLELERERNLGKQLDSTMLQLHGDRVVLALRGHSDVIIEKETVVTEVVEPDTGKSTKILTADQLKQAVKERTGQKLSTAKQFTDALRKAGRDDLLEPVRRSQVTEYVKPEFLDEAIAVVYKDQRQILLGE